jgi:hypothetical protein
MMLGDVTVAAVKLAATGAAAAGPGPIEKSATVNKRNAGVSFMALLLMENWICGGRGSGRGLIRKQGVLKKTYT